VSLREIRSAGRAVMAAGVNCGFSPIPADNDVREIAGFLVKIFTYYVFSEELLHKNVDTGPDYVPSCSLDGAERHLNSALMTLSTKDQRFRRSVTCYHLAEAVLLDVLAEQLVS